MTSAQALHQFWSSFGIPAYESTTVPDDVSTPYITYSVATGYLNDYVSLSASVWDRSTSWLFVTDKADEISRAIGFAGKTIPFDGGYIRLHRGVPFSQRLADEDETIRRMYIDIAAEFIAV